jgi:hypothetical protein
VVSIRRSWWQQNPQNRCLCSDFVVEIIVVPQKQTNMYYWGAPIALLFRYLDRRCSSRFQKTGALSLQAKDKGFDQLWSLNPCPLLRSGLHVAVSINTSIQTPYCGRHTEFDPDRTKIAPTQSPGLRHLSLSSGPSFVRTKGFLPFRQPRKICRPLRGRGWPVR